MAVKPSETGVEPIEIREGPQYIDPRKVISNQAITTSDDLGGKLSSIIKGKDPISQMDDFVNGLYGNFVTNIDVPTRIPASEFQKFELLYSREIGEQVKNGTATSAILEQIDELSKEFCMRVNIHKPIHIVDDITGEDVCPPLPPLYGSLNLLREKGTEAIDYFHGAFNRSDGVKGGLGEREVARATANLTQVLVAAQDGSHILETIETTNQMANEFHKQVFGKPVFDDMEPGKPATETKQVSDNPDDWMEFK